MKLFSIIILWATCSLFLKAQDYIDIGKIRTLDLNGLTVANTVYKGKECVEAYFDSASIDEYFIGIPNIDFKNGIIELEVTGEPGKYADEGAKGFVGIAFRIQNDSTYECMYIRPVNATDENQIFRNRAVQYTSRPIYTWKKLREESPGKYETYCPTKPGEWTKLKIVVEGCKAFLFVNDAKEPTLIVNDLKLGADTSGGVGLWVGSFTLAHFRNFRIRNSID